MEAQAQDLYGPRRSRMVGEIAALARGTGAETGRAVRFVPLTDKGERQQ